MTEPLWLQVPSKPVFTYTEHLPDTLAGGAPICSLLEVNKVRSLSTDQTNFILDAPG